MCLFFIILSVSFYFLSLFFLFHLPMADMYCVQSEKSFYYGKKKKEKKEEKLNANVTIGDLVRLYFKFNVFEFYARKLSSEY